jgi:tRNA (guanine37-N1)-methyltransferase
MIVDAVTRLIPGALGNEDSTVNESFSEQLENATSNDESFLTRHPSPATSHSLLDFPHYTRPASFRGWDVPEVLLSGNHEVIRRWRREKAREKTLRNRPDLWNVVAGSRR